MVKEQYADLNTFVHPRNEEWRREQTFNALLEDVQKKGKRVDQLTVPVPTYLTGKIDPEQDVYSGTLRLSVTFEDFTTGKVLWIWEDGGYGWVGGKRHGHEGDYAALARIVKRELGFEDLVLGREYFGKIECGRTTFFRVRIVDLESRLIEKRARWKELRHEDLKRFPEVWAPPDTPLTGNPHAIYVVPHHAFYRKWLKWTGDIDPFANLRIDRFLSAGATSRPYETVAEIPKIPQKSGNSEQNRKLNVSTGAKALAKVL